MKKLGINISVVGGTGTGKSSIMSLLERLLIKEGFEVEMNFEGELDDYGTEEKFRAAMAHNTELRETAIKEKSKVVIKTIQTVLPPLDAPKGDPNCNLCRGKGEYSYSTFDGGTTTTKICDCVRFRNLMNINIVDEDGS